MWFIIPKITKSKLSVAAIQGNASAYTSTELAIATVVFLQVMVMKTPCSGDYQENFCPPENFYPS